MGLKSRVVLMSCMIGKLIVIGVEVWEYAWEKKTVGEGLNCLYLVGRDAKSCKELRKQRERQAGWYVRSDREERWSH